MCGNDDIFLRIEVQLSIFFFRKLNPYIIQLSVTWIMPNVLGIFLFGNPLPLLKNKFLFCLNHQTFQKLSHQVNHYLHTYTTYHLIQKIFFDQIDWFSDDFLNEPFDITSLRKLENICLNFFLENSTKLQNSKKNMCIFWARTHFIQACFSSFEKAPFQVWYKNSGQRCQCCIAV